MTARGDNHVADLAALAARLGELADFAERGAAPPAWLEETLSLLVTALLGKVDPRRQRTLERAAVIGRAAAAGATPEQLAARFGLTPSWIRRLCALNEAHATSRAFFPVERQSSPPTPPQARRQIR